MRAPARIVPLALVVGLAAGCGGDGDASAEEQDPTRPPPAYAQAGGDEVRLGISTYCWTYRDRGVCADGPPPECGAEGVPDVRVERGASVVFELGFDPQQVGIAGGQALDPVRTPEWLPPEEGPFALTALEDRGDVAYVGCVVYE